MPNPPEVQQLADALKAGAANKALADAIMAAISPKTSGVYDTGANEYLVVWPGYGPLTPAAQVPDFFKVLEEL